MSTDANAADTVKENTKPNLLEDEWLIRGSAIYDEEYSDCTSIKGRLHQYFVYGETIDCTQWKRDSNNCYKWEQNKDINAAKQLIASERLRRLTRLQAHYANTTWKKRTSTPEEWNKPLPAKLQEEYEHTYLNIKNKEMNGEIPPQLDIQLPRFQCNIL